MFDPKVERLFSTQIHYKQEKGGVFTFLDEMPIIGNVKALFEIYLKATVKKEEIDNNHYYEYLKDKSYFTLILQAIPYVGIVASAVSSIYRYEIIQKKTNKLLREADQNRYDCPKALLNIRDLQDSSLKIINNEYSDSSKVHDFFTNKVKSWEKAKVARYAIESNRHIYKHLPEELRLRYDLAILAMQKGVPPNEIDDRLRNNVDFMKVAIGIFGLSPKYASEELRAKDTIIEIMMKWRYKNRNYAYSTIRNKPRLQLEFFPIETLQRLLAKVRLENPQARESNNSTKYYNISPDTVLADFRWENMVRLSKEDQKKLLTTIFQHHAENLGSIKRIRMFSREALQEVLHENETTYGVYYTQEMKRILVEYRTSAPSTVIDMRSGDIIDGPSAPKMPETTGPEHETAQS